MKYGVTVFATDLSMGPVELARAVEERGYNSLYIPEHTHIPTSRRTPPPTGDAVLAEEYKRTLDPFVALAAAAAVTENLVLGTGVSVIAQHEPIVTAKQIATLDLVSGGRTVLGIGYGWNHDEMENHGVDPRTRRARVREHVMAMQALWSNDVASFEGEFVSFEPSWSWPKPVQAGGPPILLGGAPGPTLFRHIAEFGDGWVPFGGAGVREALADLHRACEHAGRDPAEIRVVLFGTIPDDPGKLAYYEDLGVEEIVLRIPAGGPDVVLPALDGYTRFHS